MAILQLVGELMEVVQGQRAAEITEEAVVALTAETGGETGDAPPPPAATPPIPALPRARHRYGKLGPEHFHPGRSVRC